LLLFRTFEGATTAAGELARAGFNPQAHPEAVAGRWSCVATKTLVPELEALRLIRAQLSGLATRLEGKYDGWGTAVRRGGDSDSANGTGPPRATPM
jgi:hypothetical protein